MQDYNVSRFTRRCHLSQRPLEPGERFYSVVIARGSELVRMDIAEQRWQGPPEDTIGWWRGKMPPQTAKALRPASNHQLLEMLTQLCEQPESRRLAYVLGVLLMRKRVLAEEKNDSPPPQQGFLHLVHPHEGTEYWVPDHPPETDQLETIQAALQELLYVHE